MKSICDVCGKKFKNQFALNGHYKMKDDPAHRAWKEKNIKSNVQPETQKPSVQYVLYPPEVLKKAKELIEKETKDKIIHEYIETTIQPQFDNGIWLDNNKHQSILSKKDEEQQKEINSIKASNQMERKNLEVRNYNQAVKINVLTDENFRLKNYIDNRFDDDVRRGQEELKHRQEGFTRYSEEELLNFNKSKDELDKKKKDVQIRENKVVEREENQKKREDEFEKNKKTHNDSLEVIIKTIEKREKNITEAEKELKRSVDEKKNELNDEMEKINKANEEQKAKTQRLQNLQKQLRGAVCSNKFILPCPHCKDPMLFNTNNPEINQKIREIFGNYTHPECRKRCEQSKPVILRAVLSSGEPAVQSGVSPVFIPSENVNVAEHSGDPVLQSGCSGFYASGMVNTDKTSKKGNAVST